MSRRYLAVIIVVAIAGAAAVVAIALPALNRVGSTTSSVTLPTGCVKPAGGFLIVASQRGFNDSIDHGVPQSSWPVVNVRQGQNVTIVVCNADPVEAHGFQVTHYFDASLVSVSPGQVITVNFIADKVGSFAIKCEIFCTIHWAMQSGELVVN